MAKIEIEEYVLKNSPHILRAKAKALDTENYKLSLQMDFNRQMSLWLNSHADSTEADIEKEIKKNAKANS